MGLTANGYLRGGIKGQAVLPQPRLGFSWDVTGDHKTVVRGGFGIAFDRYQSGAGVGSGATNQPFVFNPTLTNGYLQDITPGGGGALAPQSVQGVDPERQVADRLQLQRRRAARDLEGHRGGRRLRRLAVAPQHAPREPERPALRHDVHGGGAGSDQDQRRRAGRGARPAVDLLRRGPVVQRRQRPARSTSCGRTRATATSSTTCSTDETTYNSLQASLQRRFSKGLTFGVSYTLSRAITTVSDDGTFTSNIDPEAFDRGLATFDRTHYFVANYVWNVPKRQQAARRRA